MLIIPDFRRLSSAHIQSLPLTREVSRRKPRRRERIKRWYCASPDRCYGGIAAEIDTKNMPPACFLNVSTLPQSPSATAPSSEGAKGGAEPLPYEILPMVHAFTVRRGTRAPPYEVLSAAYTQKKRRPCGRLFF